MDNRNIDRVSDHPLLRLRDVAFLQPIRKFSALPQPRPSLDLMATKSKRSQLEVLPKQNLGGHTEHDEYIRSSGEAIRCPEEICRTANVRAFPRF